ncbi:MAG: hypothetical protein M1833_004134 [Piccolia ochrophora]|nr:MAG: hypothetical protein M1833_004134 [Piccolia ochrophora]
MPPRPLHLTIRFPTSTPDLLLTLPIPTSPPSTLPTSPTTPTPTTPLPTTLTLKRQIRAHRPADTATRQLRLIHAGKVLGDDAFLPGLLPWGGGEDRAAAGGDTLGRRKPRDKGKGKARAAREEDALRGDHSADNLDADDDEDSTPALRLYIHCAIGPVLPASSLAAEEIAYTALLSSSSSSTQAPTAGSTAHATTNDTSSTTPTPTTTPAPRGFDRLLLAGFTAAEIATLRTQFLALHAPGTAGGVGSDAAGMPTAGELRALEDRWLDEGGGGGMGGGEGGLGGGGGGDGDVTGHGVVDLVLGSVVGFFWPVGAVVWGLREEGLWGGRRQMAVCAGVGVNLLFGVLRVLG